MARSVLPAAAFSLSHPATREELGFSKGFARGLLDLATWLLSRDLNSVLLIVFKSPFCRPEA